jgi:hypothetical protein
MVYAYVGLPGSGKTLTSLVLLLSELRAGRHVFTNIAGLDPLMISYALSARYARKGDYSFNLSYVNKYLHRFTLEYDADFGVSAAESNVGVNAPVAPVNDFARRSFAQGSAYRGKLSVPSEMDASKKLPAVSLEKFRVKKNDGIFNYYNSEGLALLINDVMLHKEAVVILDECHEYLNPENFSVLRPFVKYISMARHHGHDLVLITQHISDIWGPIQKRIHETHEFFRGQLGIRTHYKERVFYGSNILAAPGYVRQRVNDKSLYKLYMSHEVGVKEHLPYMSVFKSFKFIGFIVFFFVCVVFVAFMAPRAFVFLDKKNKGELYTSVADTVPRFFQNENVLYVKYVVCGYYDCKAVRPDGTTVTLPLDYASGKYPLEVRKYVPNSNAYSVGAMPGAGAKSGLPNARR